MINWKSIQYHHFPRELRGRGPQGSIFGIWEYLSQSNDSANCVDQDDRFKFVDDLTFLEVIQLLNVGLASYNIKSHVPSNIETHNQIIPSKNLRSQKHLNLINDWTHYSTNQLLSGIAASVKETGITQKEYKNYFSYKEALSKLRLEKLDCRREKICLNFAKKSFKNEKVKHFFDKDHKLHKMNTRSKNIFSK